MATTKMKIGLCVRAVDHHHIRPNKTGLIIDMDVLGKEATVQFENGVIYAFNIENIELIENIPHLKHYKITSAYTALINTKTGIIHVGCQKINFKKVHELADFLNILSRKKFENATNSKQSRVRRKSSKAK